MSESFQQLAFTDAHKHASLEATIDRVIVALVDKGILNADAQVSPPSFGVNPFMPSGPPVPTPERKTWLAGARWRDAVDAEALQRATAEGHPTYIGVGTERTVSLEKGWGLFGADSPSLHCPRCGAHDANCEWLETCLVGLEATLACGSCNATFRVDEVRAGEDSAVAAAALQFGSAWLPLSRPFIEALSATVRCELKLVWFRL